MRFAKDNETPLVSVCLITYNHERWIAASIESVLMQETDFPCEFIIADDCSPDKTREIVRSYAGKYPIKLLFQEKNKGAAGNWKDLMDAPTGKYVAYIEGDDSWIDPLKLKKQAELLESNEDLVLCYANAKINDTQNPASNIWFTKDRQIPVRLNKYQTVIAFTMPSCTLFFRNLLKPVPEWALQARSGDHLMIAMLCKHGDAYYMNECLGLYNHDYTGISRVIRQDHYLWNDFITWLRLHEYYDYDPQIWESVVQKCICDLDKLFHRGFPDKARRLFWKWPLGKVLRTSKRGQVLKLAVKIYIPFLLYLRKGHRSAVKHRQKPLPA